ncbi:exodeoxyribonuclease V subunit alpha [Williamsia serinedens]|uniref:RecBCD enzyme subunit RecD n=1 Tax=Williamsia serinedens TaxID=391736 RepID=A0ABT1GY46_9NOCA|nr:exodeoxyribonuclease V subunit alpha [Williamsia serinedens]MCP2159462.1 DNA helicase/exodeoxyribonuclease V, alpha subunit [Williamsia serinedens]
MTAETVRSSPATDDLVATFADAGVIGVADVQVARRLVRLVGGVAAPVELLVALTVRALRAGSVCVDVARLRDIPPDRDAPDGVDVADLPWPDPAPLVEALRSSPVTNAGPGGLAPLRLVRTADDAVLVYLDKYFRQEARVREVLAARAADPPTVDQSAVDAAVRALFPDDGADEPDLQALGARTAATHRTTVLAGGPGTGKTHTVARIIALLEGIDGPGLRVGLCAPTGRAAAALQAAVSGQADLRLPPVRAVTINRLLGPLPDGRRFRHSAAHRLPHDVVIVDEASMVSLTMMFRLLDAVRPSARLILVGDPDQLASVDAGAVLADLVHSVGSGDTGTSGAVVSLRRRRRFGGRIGALADAVRDGDADAVVEQLAEGRDGAAEAEVRLVTESDAGTAGVLAATTRWVRAMTAAAHVGDAVGALAALDSHRVLCAHRRGPAGVAPWQSVVARAAGVDDNPARPWYAGRPVLLTETDRRAGLHNGDTGVVVTVDGEPMVAFPGVGPGDGPRLVRPRTLRGVVSAYATTIHRSQGSQYGAVTVVIPPGRSALLTRELLYTAITRAVDSVTLVGAADDLRAGVARKVLRASGLRTDLEVLEDRG